MVPCSDRNRIRASLRVHIKVQTNRKSSKSLWHDIKEAEMIGILPEKS